MKVSLLIIAALLPVSLIAKAEPRHSFLDLDEAQQKLVRETYRDLLQSHQRKDFAKVMEDARIILELLDDYHDTKSFAEIAEKKMHSTEARKELRDE